MTKDEAIAQLVAIRRKWRNNGSTIEFSKAEQKLFNVFRLASKNPEDEWPEVRIAAYSQVP